MIDELIEQLVQLTEQVKRIPILEARIVELEAQVKQNSKNSHKPPSSDQFKPKQKPGLPRAKGKKRGGQPGHKGKNLKMVTVPDIEINHEPPLKCACGCSLKRVKKTLKERRQVFGLPEPKLVVTEHATYSCACPGCGKEVSGVFPPEVPASTQYDSSVKTFCVLLNAAYKVPYAKVKRLFEDLFGYSLNESTQITAQKKCFELLASTEKLIEQHLLESPVNHFDETGIKVSGTNHWLHGCSNKNYTYLFGHQNRGKKAIGSEVSLLPNYTGWAIHDCWASYFSYSGSRHAICGAHLLRELQALVEQNSIWADRMRDLLLYAYDLSAKGKSKVKNFNKISNQYDRICKMAEEEEPPPLYRYKGKKPKKTKGRNLMDRLKEHKAGVLAFAQYEEVPFTNNQAERDVRPAKIKQKVSGGFRTFEGLKRYARIQGFISTARKQQRNVFKELLATFNGQKFLLVKEGAK